jgi:hypothetical protein
MTMSTRQGETTTASSGGRSLGRDDITASHTDVTVPFHRTDGTPPLFAGFRQNWFDGATADGVEYDLSAGAGFGSKYLTLQVRVGDVTVHEYVDMAEVFEARIMAIIAELKAPTEQPDERPAEQG